MAVLYLFVYLLLLIIVIQILKNGFNTDFVVSCVKTTLRGYYTSSESVFPGYRTVCPGVFSFMMSQ